MNGIRSDIKIILDKERVLRFDLNAMCRFEEATDKSMFDGTFQSIGMSAKDIRAMLWACLLHEDEAVTLEHVGSLVSANNMAEVVAKLGEAFEVAIQPAVPKESESPL